MQLDTQIFPLHLQEQRTGPQIQTQTGLWNPGVAPGQAMAHQPFNPSLPEARMAASHTYGTSVHT